MKAFWKYGMLAISIYGALWMVDRSNMCDWVGTTNLDVTICAFDAATGQTIEGARIELAAEFPTELTGDFHESATDHLYHAWFTTGPSGKVEIHCNGVTCSGTRSFLLFTNTYHVYRPNWRIDCQAPGFERIQNQWINDFKNPLIVRHVAPGQNELTIPLSMRFTNRP